MAKNWLVVPTAIEGFGGVTAMDTSVAAVTVSAAEPDILPTVAVIVVDPAAPEVARPLAPVTLLTAATAEADELQFAAAVRSCVVLSE